MVIFLLLSKRIKKFIRSANEISGYAVEYEHSTRFKEKILKRIPELTEHKMGRYVILTLKVNCVKAIFKACDLQDNYGGYQTRSACQNNMKRLSLEEPKLLIRLFIHTLLSNGVPLVKKLET